MKKAQSVVIIWLYYIKSYFSYKYIHVEVILLSFVVYGHSPKEKGKFGKYLEDKNNCKGWYFEWSMTGQKMEMGGSWGMVAWKESEKAINIRVVEFPLPGC